MDDPPSQAIVFVLAALSVIGFIGGSFFSAVRTSLFALDKQMLPPFDDPELSGNTRILMRLFRRPARLFIGTGVGEIWGYSCALTFGTAATLIAKSPLDNRGVALSAITFAVIALIILLIGRVLLAHYMGTPDFALDWAPLLVFLMWLIFPVVWITENVTIVLYRPGE